jgi:hypothetical protein
MTRRRLLMECAVKVRYREPFFAVSRGHRLARLEQSRQRLVNLSPSSTSPLQLEVTQAPVPRSVCRFPITTRSTAGRRPGGAVLASLECFQSQSLFAFVKLERNSGSDYLQCCLFRSSLPVKRKRPVQRLNGLERGESMLWSGRAPRPQDRYR